MWVKFTDSGVYIVGFSLLSGKFSLKSQNLQDALFLIWSHQLKRIINDTQY